MAVDAAPPNITVKLVRPGFGPAAELPSTARARRRHARLQIASRCISLIAATGAPQTLRRAGPAAQLTVRCVRRAECSVTAEALRR